MNPKNITRKVLMLAVLLIGMVFSIQAQVARLPDCFLYFSLTADGSSETYDNRQVGCADWSVAYADDGLTALSLTLQEAPVSGGSPGAFVAWTGTVLVGSNPETNTASGYIRAAGYRPYVRVNLSGSAGSGTIKGILYGYRTTDAATGSSGASVSISGQPIQVQGNQAEGAAVSGNPQLVAGWDGTSARTIKTDGQGKLVLSPGQSVGLSDGPNLDAFSRLRVSDPVALFDSSLYYGENDLLWDGVTSGGGSLTTNVNKASVSLGVGTGATDRAYRQVHQYARYQAGRSQLIAATGVFGSPATHTDMRIGYFDDDNGLFFQLTGGSTPSLGVVVRSSITGSAVDQVVPQSSWNLDRLDGTGPSGITLDITRAQIFLIDFQWLGVGRVRFGFDIDGKIVYVHEVLNSNHTLKSVYMQTASLPVRYEIVNDGTSPSAGSSMEQICATITRESGSNDDLQGYGFSANTGAATIAVTSRVPVLSIRPKQTFHGHTNRVKVDLDNISITAGSNNILYEIVYNGTLGGSPSWSDVNSTHSSVQSDTSATSITGGIVIASGYVASGRTRNPSAATRSILHKLGMALDAAGTTADTVSIVATAASGTANVSASVDWTEYY